MTDQPVPSALPPKPPQYSDLEWQALLAGAELRRGKQHEDNEPVHEIRWPNGAVTDLLRPPPLGPFASGGYVRLDAASTVTFERSCWIDRPASVIPPEGVKLAMNFEAGFDVDLTPAMAKMIRSLTAGAPVDPRVDEEWDAWRCPACGRSHAEVKAGHAWFVDGAGNVTCNGENT